MKDDLLTISVSTAKKMLWKGQGEAVSSENTQGFFDILPQHANFITIIKNKPITLHLQGGNKKAFTFKTAVIYTHDSIVKIYANI